MYLTGYNVVMMAQLKLSNKDSHNMIYKDWTFKKDYFTITRLRAAIMVN